MVKKRRVGKPKKELNKRQILELAKIQCTLSEIAAVMDCSPDTISDNYSSLIKKGREIGKESLRRAQWNKGVKEGNTQMLIWLGRFHLGQKEEMVLNSSEPEVRELLNKWEISAQKKSSFNKNSSDSSSKIQPLNPESNQPFVPFNPSVCSNK